MTDYDGFLMRDSLSDSGVVPSPGYPFYSPDIIAHAQVDDPKSFFTSNYSSDPNQPVEQGSRLNPVYVRAKNLSTLPLSGYYISVFRANTSLFMHPSVWKNNPLSTASGETSVALPLTAQPGTICVGTDCFLLDAVTSNLFCCVAMVSPTRAPVIPADFPDYSSYLTWVRTNQNVCGRNLNSVRGYANRSFERLDSFSNPSTTDAVPTLFQVTVKGTLPADTLFGLQCTPLNINTSWNISAGPVQTTSGMTPPSFDGTVTTWVTLPTGVSWPGGASVETKVYVGISSGDPEARFHTPLKALGVRREEVEGLGNDQLVLLGNCQTLFVSS